MTFGDDPTDLVAWRISTWFPEAELRDIDGCAADIMQTLRRRGELTTEN